MLNPVNMGVPTNRNGIQAVQFKPTRLELQWRDGHQSVFPSIWLLQACGCDACGTTETAVRHVRLTDQPQRPEIKGASMERGNVLIDWGNQHVSAFSMEWLRGHCLSSNERARRRAALVPWAEEMAATLPSMMYKEVAGKSERHLSFLETLRDIGFVILRDVPKESERTEEIASLVGKLRLTNYGIYELKAKPNPEIVGDMAVPLALHTDEPYRIEPPAITFFHVLEQSSDGGKSTLADGINIAGLLEQQDPEAFELLCTTPARFHRTLREGRIFESHAPIIARNEQNKVTGIRLLDRGMGPLDAPVEQVEPFYDALRKLLEIVYRGEGQIAIKLDSGDMLVFNNQRVMHGRTAFDPSTSCRHVRSCHVDLDEFHSRLRSSYRAHGREEVWMRLGSGRAGA